MPESAIKFGAYEVSQSLFRNCVISHLISNLVGETSVRETRRTQRPQKASAHITVLVRRYWWNGSPVCYALSGHGYRKSSLTECSQMLCLPS